METEEIKLLKEAVSRAVSAGYHWSWIEKAKKLIESKTDYLLCDYPNAYNSNTVVWKRPGSQLYSWEEERRKKLQNNKIT